MKLEVKDLYKSFGGTEVLHGISFSVESGRALGLLGRNGAGKTTTIRILMQVFAANKGTVTLDGVPFSTKKIGIGYLPEASTRKKPSPSSLCTWRSFGA